VRSYILKEVYLYLLLMADGESTNSSQSAHRIRRLLRDVRRLRLTIRTSENWTVFFFHLCEMRCIDFRNNKSLTF
jgi:hypothetical protein